MSLLNNLIFLSFTLVLHLCSVFVNYMIYVDAQINIRPRPIGHAINDYAILREYLER